MIKREENERYWVYESNQGNQGRFMVKEGVDFFCYICNEPRIMTGVELKKHFMNEHPSEITKFLKIADFEKMTPICEICNESFASLKLLNAHLDIHQAQYKCNVCEKEFKLIFEYSLHQYSHTKIFQCELCQNVNNNRSSFRYHYSKHLISLRPYLCEICDKRFWTASVFRLHRQKHEGLRNLQCEFCARLFVTAPDLRTHVLGHHPEKVNGRPTQYSCNKCDRIFKWSMSLKHHQSVAHDLKSHICEICGKHFLTVFYLKRHMARHGEKKFECSLCPKKFPRKCDLSEHTLIHTGRKPYPCRICGKGFTQCGSRKIHERAHNNDKPFKCNLCGKGFYSGGAMNVHIKTCSGIGLQAGFMDQSARIVN